MMPDPMTHCSSIVRPFIFFRISHNVLPLQIPAMGDRPRTWTEMRLMGLMKVRDSLFTHLFNMTDCSEKVIYPVDYKATSHIVDDDMHMIMV